MNEILSKREIGIVDEILIDILGIAQTQIIPEARIKEDLSADSLHITEIALAIEEQFQLAVPDEDWEKVRTVGELYGFLARVLDCRKDLEANHSNDGRDLKDAS
jgi:acyl carrier protein